MPNQDLETSRGYGELVIASGAQNKLQAARREYDKYIFWINGINPEEAYDRKESESPSAGSVAYEKTEAVIEHYVDSPYLVIGADVCTWVWKAGESMETAKEMKKPSRTIDSDDPAQVQELLKEVQVEARELYCNGQFFVVWNVGIVLRDSRGTMCRGVVIECVADFANGIPPEVVKDMTSTETAIHDSTYVNLAKQAGSYATNLAVRNKGEIGVEEPLPPELLELFVHGCVLPQDFFAQLIATDAELQEIHGEKFQQVYLNFSRPRV